MLALTATEHWSFLKLLIIEEKHDVLTIGYSVPAHGRGIRTRWSLRPLSTQIILHVWFYSLVLSVLPNHICKVYQFLSVAFSCSFYFTVFRGSRLTKYIRHLFLFRGLPWTQARFLWTLIPDPHSSGSLTINLSSGAGKGKSAWLARSFWVLLTSCFYASTLQQRLSDINLQVDRWCLIHFPGTNKFSNVLLLLF